MGDPAGIGPEVALKALAAPAVSQLANFLIIGDNSVIDRMKRALNLKVDIPVYDLANVSLKDFSFGRPSPAMGRAAIGYIDKALELLKANEADALVTAPVSKSAVSAAGIAGFKGHTEYLAARTGTREFAMMFVGEKLKVTLATRHIALKRVAQALTVKSVRSAILLTHEYLKKFFRVKRPRIGVAGLNPHAGENSLFGCEEEAIIKPAVRSASKMASGVKGPVPADVIFHEALNGKFDAVVSMYHDQGLIPFKTLYFKNGVNLTLGLPFIRTSPDHGTAFDIAGRFIADPTSMREAIILACRLSRRRATSRE